jgi:hypothetical protein
MPIQVGTVAMLQYSFGASSATLSVRPVNRVTAGTFRATIRATIMDNIPYGSHPDREYPALAMCSSIANPTVVSATAAAQG